MVCFRIPVVLFVCLASNAISSYAIGVTPQISDDGQSAQVAPLSNIASEATLQLSSAAIGLQKGAATTTQVTASGTVIYNWAGKEVPGNISVLWNSSTGLQVTSETALGTRTQTADWKTETVTDERKRVTTFGSHTAARSQLKYFPTVELASILVAPAKELGTSVTTVLNGAEVDVVHVAGLWPAISVKPVDREVTLYLDHKTHLIVQRTDSIETTPGSPGRLARSMQYSDYRKVNGVFYPFAISESLGGQHIYSITFTSISAN